MAIDLRSFASGDTDYIAKMNQNVSALTNAINQLQTQFGLISQTDPASIGQFLIALFHNADALIGNTSYVPTFAGATLSIAPGGMFLADSLTTVAAFAVTTINFIGRAAGTYYVKVTAAGTPISAVDTLVDEPGVVYSVEWTGTAFTGLPLRLVPVYFDILEADASRKSLAWGNDYQSLDARFEAGEVREAVTTPVRTMTFTVDNTTGIKGLIQADFQGTIIGWSIIANASGSISIEIDKKASSPPPAAPAIPNTTTDKISASAPIALSGAQSASSATAGVSTWNTTVEKWDVIQLNVASITTITKATVYLRIQETVSSPPHVDPFE